MRIVQLVANLEIGGLERLALNLSRPQEAAGHHTSIYCLGQRGKLATEAEASGIPVIAFGKRPDRSPRTLWRIARHLLRDRQEVLYGHNHPGHHYVVLAGRLARVPVVANTRHGQEIRFIEKPGGTGYDLSMDSPDPKAGRIFRATLRWADAVNISDHTRRFFMQYRGIPAEVSRVILNGAPLDPFFAEPASPGAVRPRFRFGTMGRMVPAFLSKLDAFVLSSISEGLPIAILEAMATCFQIESTRVAGVPEAAPDGSVAMYTPIGQVRALAGAIGRTAIHPDAAARGQQRRALAQTRFTIENTWKEHEFLFESLLARSAA